MLHYILLLIIFLSPFCIQAQLLVYPPIPDPGQTEGEFFAAQLAGAGVEISNVQVTCGDDSYGLFRNPDPNNDIANFGLNQGVVMTTGNLSDVPGPSSGIVSTSVGTAGDPDLADLAQVNTQDACVIEFDITPIGESLSFKYVFGSEEYDSYVCSSFNDVFGFLISGPDPNGGSYNSMNIALIPGTDIPVAVSTVNDGFSDGGGGPVCILDYSEYYNDVIPEIEFEGITDTFTAFVNVIPCETYTLKLAIADGVDSALDSGVFIEAGSFTSPEPNLALSGGYEIYQTNENGNIVFDADGNPIPLYTDNEGNANGVLVEGCEGKIITFGVDDLDTEVTINLNISSGTATNGVDFTLADGSPIPENITITPENPTVTYEIFAVEDGDAEIIENIIVEITGINSVSCVLSTTTASDTIYIIDNILNYAAVEVVSASTCPGGAQQVEAFGGDSYHWYPESAFVNSNPNIFNPIANVNETTTVFCEIINGPCIDTFSLELAVAPQEIPVAQEQYSICTAVPITLQAANAKSYEWILVDGSGTLSCYDCETPEFTPDGTNSSTFALYTTSNPSGCANDTIFVNVDFENLPFLQGPESLVKCADDDEPIELSGGVSYEWNPPTGLSCSDCPNPMIMSDVPITYTVTAINQFDCEDQIQIAVDVITMTADAGDDYYQCVAVEDYQIGPFESDISADFTYSWTPTMGLSDPNSARPFVNLEANDGVITYTLTVEHTNGCMATSEVTVEAKSLPSINIPDDEPLVILGGGTSLQASGAGDGGFYNWSPSTGLSNATSAFVTASPTDTTTYIVTGTDQFNCKSTDSITVNVIDPPRIFLPTAFSPNGDGLNDVFRITGKDIEELTAFKVYNRWGQMIYDNPNDLSQGWDGTYEGEVQNIGVYVYFVQFSYEGNPETETLKGTVTLVR